MPADPVELLSTLRQRALCLPDVSEGVACEGTALEKRTLKVHGKAFQIGRAHV